MKGIVPCTLNMQCCTFVNRKMNNSELYILLKKVILLKYSPLLRRVDINIGLNRDGKNRRQ